MDNPHRKHTYLPWLFVAAVWAVLHGIVAVTANSSVLDGIMPGPDEYMRLVRVTELHDGGQWYDTVIDRSNVPYGESLHWTRPLDLLILAVATTLSPFLSTKTALFAAAVAISPLLVLLGSFATGWAAYPLLGRRCAIGAALMVLIQPAVLGYSAPGRADHHGLLFLLFALVIGSTIRMLAPRPATQTAVIAGVCYGLAMWTSVELTLFVGLCQAAALLAWICFPAHQARPQLLAAVSFLATMLLALMAERSPSDLFTVEFDRLSAPFVAIAAMPFMAWAGACWLQYKQAAGDTPRRRLLAVAIASVLGAAGVIALFPDLLSGPFAGMDARIQKLWLYNVIEMRPLVPTTLRKTGEFLFYLFGVTLALPYCLIVGWRQRQKADGAPWLFLGATIAVYFALALNHFRMSPFAEIASVPAIIHMLARVIVWSNRQLGHPQRLLVNSTAGFVLILGGFTAGAHLMTVAAETSNATSPPECRIADIATALNDPAGLGDRTHTIATLVDRGPAILYHTHHSVVGAPYHRNGSGIWELHRLFAAPDEAESREIIARRGVDLLLVCPTGAERKFFKSEIGATSLYSRLLDGSPPDWLAPVAIPEMPEGFRIYRVIR